MDIFRKMRRERQQLSAEESISILQKATSGTLALLGDNGYPYAVPISYVYSEGKLYFHRALSGHKIRMLALRLDIEHLTGKEAIELVRKHNANNI